MRHVRSRLWQRVLAFIISGVINGVGGFLGRAFVLTGTYLSKIELRTELYCCQSPERSFFGFFIISEFKISD